MTRNELIALRQKWDDAHSASIPDGFRNSYGPIRTAAEIVASDLSKRKHDRAISKAKEEYEMALEAFLRQESETV